MYSANCDLHLFGLGFELQEASCTDFHPVLERFTAGLFPKEWLNLFKACEISGYHTYRSLAYSTSSVMATL